MAIFFAIISLTELIASPIAGWICDHYDRRFIFIMADTVRATTAAVLAAILATENLHWGICLSAVLYASCDRVALTASQAMIPAIETRLTSATANSMVFFVMQSGSLLAAALTGVLLHASSMTVAFASIAMAFALSTCGMLFVRQGRCIPPAVIKAGGPALRLDEQLLYLGAVYVLLYVGGFLVSVLGPGFVFDELSGNALDFGKLEGAWSAGSILGAVLLIPLSPSTRIRTLLFCVLAITAISFASLKLLAAPWALFVFAILGMSYNLGRVAIEVSLQSTVPITALGRAKGALHCAGVLLGLVLFGVIAVVSNQMRPSTMFLIFAVFLAAATVLLAISRAYRD